MNPDDPRQADVTEAIQSIGEAQACTEILAKFVQSDQFDMQKFSYQVGETLAMVQKSLSDAHCTLLNATIQVVEEPAP
jgi:hypothetical protein